MTSGEKMTIDSVVRTLESAEKKVRFSAGVGPEIGAANDIAAQIDKLKKLADLSEAAR
jgi:hypothetical protein